MPDMSNAEEVMEHRVEEFLHLAKRCRDAARTATAQAETWEDAAERMTQDLTKWRRFNQPTQTDGDGA